MIQQNDAVKLEDGTVQPRHTVEIYCPNCGRDVDETELTNGVCNDCGTVTSSGGYTYHTFTTSGTYTA